MPTYPAHTQPIRDLAAFHLWLVPYAGTDPNPRQEPTATQQAAAVLLKVNDSGVLEIAGNFDLNGTYDLVFDADGDTYLSSDSVDDVVDFYINGAKDLTFSANQVLLYDATNLVLGTGSDDTIGHDGTLTTWTHNTGDLVIDNTDTNDQIILRVGTDTSATGIEFRNNSDAVMFSVSPSSASAGTILAVGVLDVNGTLDLDAALTAAGDAANIAATVNHATANAYALDVSIAAITTARTAGDLIGVRSSITSLTGSTAGVDHVAFAGICTAGDADSDHILLRQGAGFNYVIDSRAALTGETHWILADAVADALTIEDAAGNDFLVIDTVAADGMTFGNATTNPVYSWLGSGALSMIGGGGLTVAGLRVQSPTAVAITGATVLTLADSGGIFTVAQSSAYDIDLPSPTTGAGLRFMFQLVSPGSFNVTITVASGAASFEGILQNDVTGTVPATGSTFTFASGVAVLGDYIEVWSTATGKYFARASSSANGGITIA